MRSLEMTGLTIHDCTHQKYGTKNQFVQDEDNLSAVGKEEQQYITW